MGYLKDLFSGKIRRRNVLVHGNVQKLLGRCEELPISDFTRHWCQACLTSIYIIIESWFFSDKTDQKMNPFKQHIDRLDQEKVFEMMKLLASHHLTTFERNESNLECLKALAIDLANFEEQVFDVFSFADNDRRVFSELKKATPEDREHPYLILYRKIFERVFEMPVQRNIHHEVLISGIISDAYTCVFTDVLISRLRAARLLEEFSVR
jgi:hypothetical protein